MIRVDHHPQCSGSFACLRSRPSKALLRAGTTVEVVVARCRNCSSKLCWKCGPCGLRSVQQKAAAQELQRNCNFGTATSYYLLNGFPKGIQVCVGGSLAFLIDDLTVYGRWHIFRVHGNPQCSGNLACVGSHPSLASTTVLIRPVLPFCPFWLHTLICLNSPELHCWLSSHPHCIKMLGFCFRVYVRRSQGAGTDAVKDSMPRACCRSDLPKDSRCLHFVVIDCMFVVRKVFGMTLPKTACQGHAVVS